MYNTCVINPLGKDLAAIDDANTDYDFSVYGGAIDLGTDGTNATDANATKPNTDTLPRSGTTLAQSYIVVFDLDNHSISTLGTAVGSCFMSRAINVSIGGSLV